MEQAKTAAIVLAADMENGCTAKVAKQYFS